MPCAFSNFDYFARINVAIFAPMIISGLLILGGIMWSVHHHKQLREKKISLRRSTLRRARKRGSHDSVVKTGLWRVASAILFIVDLLYPQITRTLFQMFTCHDLGSAGRWLEAARHLFAEHFFQIERIALHSYDPVSHSC